MLQVLLNFFLLFKQVSIIFQTVCSLLGCLKWKIQVSVSLGEFISKTIMKKFQNGSFILSSYFCSVVFPLPALCLSMLCPLNSHPFCSVLLHRLLRFSYSLQSILTFSSSSFSQISIFHHLLNNEHQFSLHPPLVFFGHMSI